MKRYYADEVESYELDADGFWDIKMGEDVYLASDVADLERRHKEAVWLLQETRFSVPPQIAVGDQVRANPTRRRIEAFLAEEAKIDEST